MFEFELSTETETAAETTTETTTETETEGEDYIMFKGEKCRDFITVEDGTQVPRIDERIPSGEGYAFANMIAYYYGATVGESEYTSKAYDTDHHRFPNRAIGQTEDNPEPDHERALSPGHFLYHKYGRKAVKNPVKDEFHAAVEEQTGFKMSILDYKMNFPVRKSPETGKEFTVVEENSDEPWNALQIPGDDVTEMPETLMEKVDESEPEPEPEPETETGTLKITDEFLAANEDSNKVDTIHNALAEYPVLQEIPRAKAVECLMEIADSSSSYTYEKYDDFMGMQQAADELKEETETDDDGGFEFEQETKEVKQTTESDDTKVNDAIRMKEAGFSADEIARILN